MKRSITNSLLIVLTLLSLAFSALGVTPAYAASTWQLVGARGFSAGFSAYTSLALDGSGTPYVAFRDYAKDYKATVMKFDGTGWVTVGTAGFSAGEAYYTSLALDGIGTPYVAFMDGDNGYKATVMKFDGTGWVTVGTAGFSAGEAYYISLALDGSGTPFVAYRDTVNGYKATVMKFDGTGWVAVGTAGFSADHAYYTSLALDGSGTPYVAFMDVANGYKATVMKFDGAGWVTVGTAGFSKGYADYISLALDGSGMPFVAYRDGDKGYKATVMKFDGAAWVTVGTPGFSAGEANYTSLALDGIGTPYVAFMEGINGYKATVMKFDGAEWVTVGAAGFSAGDAYYTSLALDGSGTPYVAFMDVAKEYKATVMKYAELNHTVTFNANGGSGSMDPQTAGSPTPLTLNAFTRTGYTFSGWNTAANGSGTAYADGDTYAFNADTTLYVQWTTATYRVSGHTGTGDVTLSYDNNGQKTVISDGKGNYTITVPYGWSGTVTPSKAGYVFTPSSRSYKDVTVDFPGEDYTGLPGANIDVYMGNWTTPVESYLLGRGEITREYYNFSGGPAKVESTNDANIVAAIRLQSFVKDTLLDYNETMGIPEGSLSTKYIFPVYENKWAPLNSQIRFAHLGTGTKTIKVTIGTETWTYDVAEGQDKRISLDRSGGPVIVESADGVTKIIAAIRLQAFANNTLNAYSETLGVPAEALSARYYFPVYENKWAPLNSQIRFAHLGTGTKTIKVTIGAETWTYDVAQGQDKRISLDRSGGPVIVESLDGTKIIAAIRLQSFVKDTLLDYNETMGIPEGSLSTKYIFPVYENKWAPLNSQIRFAHLGTGTKTIKVTIGTETWTYDVAEGKDMRISLDRSGGPVIVESLDGVTNIVAAIRLQGMANNVLNFYNETLGIPFGLLSDAYYFPVYENLWAPLNSQVRFGLP